MLKDLISYFEEIELDDLTDELNNYGVEFISMEKLDLDDERFISSYEICSF